MSGFLRPIHLEIASSISQVFTYLLALYGGGIPDILPASLDNESITFRQKVKKWIPSCSHFLRLYGAGYGPSPGTMVQPMLLEGLWCRLCTFSRDYGAPSLGPKVQAVRPH